MMGSNMLKRYIAGAPTLAALVYVALVCLFVALAFGALADVQDRRAAVAATADALERLQGRKPPPLRVATADNAQTGSAFLEGPTVTVAGAALLQRVAGAVVKVGGNVLSSQVELQGNQSKAGFIGVIASCEVDQSALQRLLYDLEAGMPFLFVEQLVVQAPTSASGAEDGRMRLMLAVYGQWQGGK
jgi:general secretion pathway protein M